MLTYQPKITFGDVRASWSIIAGTTNAATTSRLRRPLARSPAAIRHFPTLHRLLQARPRIPARIFAVDTLFPDARQRGA
jgi:hypothetical protein